jgi:hypothetical protein
MQKGRTKKRKRNIEGKIYRNEKRSQKKFKKKKERKRNNLERRRQC